MAMKAQTKLTLVVMTSVLLLSLVALGKEPAAGTSRKWWLPVHPWMIRMCFLFDPVVDPTVANDKIKKMSEAYASCGIQLVPYSFTIKSNYPKDHKAIAEAAAAACPLEAMFGSRGAIQIETKYAELPKEMCLDKEAKGCSTLCRPLSISVLAPNAGAAVGLHESMHSNCCGPFCVDVGAGRGIPAGGNTEIASLQHDHDSLERLFHAATGRPSELTVTKEGCQGLRAGASRNEVGDWYQPPKHVYYSYDPNPENHFDLMAAKPFFKDGVPLERPEATPKPAFIASVPTSKGSTRLLAPLKGQIPVQEPEVTTSVPGVTIVTGVTPADKVAAWPDPPVFVELEEPAAEKPQPIWKSRRENAYLAREQNEELNREQGRNAGGQ